MPWKKAQNEKSPNVRKTQKPRAVLNPLASPLLVKLPTLERSPGYRLLPWLPGNFNAFSLVGKKPGKILLEHLENTASFSIFSKYFSVYVNKNLPVDPHLLGTVVSKEDSSEVPVKMASHEPGL